MRAGIYIAVKQFDEQTAAWRAKRIFAGVAKTYVPVKVMPVGPRLVSANARPPHG
ncbi:unnamed protein product [Fusarium graminearum]|uniref:Chromosome 2, complete genome n=1 Tax=Gibberella zeae (strain ATCC MYA-4620 / CBS 123657 / FGSC 9075 / NRRL 31084 / PH-1) TaxID=229533 RepID=A0A098DJH5_GIBZE|nr:unnamed protein product [Fusarium graminearum]